MGREDKKVLAGNIGQACMRLSHSTNNGEQ